MVESLGFGEGAMSSFVGEFPETNEDEALGEAVRRPCEEAEIGRW